MVETDRGVKSAQILVDLLCERAPAELAAWLQAAMPTPGPGFGRGAFLAAFAGCGRRFAKVAVDDAPAHERMRAAGIVVPQVHDAACLARIALLLKAMPQVAPEAQVTLARDLVLRGDSRERIAVLRSLSLLPAPERFVELAVDACRSHVQDVFDAVACDNPFPAAHFPDLNFNQLVMKALFTEVPLSRVIGWQRRNNAELVRMARDYRDERVAAGRSVPDDIARIEETHR